MTARPLRIGITCYPLIGGSGILATALGSDLARRGNEVHFFSSAKPVRLDLSQPGIFFHEVVVNEYSLFKYPDYTLPLAVKMAGIGRARQLDIFHVHYAVPHATAAWLAVQMLDGPGPGVPRIVTTLHGTDTTLLGHDPNYRDAIEHSLAQSDAITTVSENLRQETLRTFRLDRLIEVVPNFFVPAVYLRSRADVRGELGVADSDFLIVHTSNLRPLKRIDLLLRVFAATRSPQPMYLLILAGESFAPYEPLLDELEVRSRVLVKEGVLNIEDYLAAADAGLYTSETESFGLSILETLFHAKPVVAFRVGGIPEVVSDGQTGFLHPFSDTSAMAASLDQLAESPQRARVMGELGQKHAKAKFSAELVVPQYQAIYERLARQALTAAQAGVNET
jgi:L-malate glycosyltransferase